MLIFHKGLFTTNMSTVVSHILATNEQQHFINLFIYLFLAALGLRCCVRASSSCGERGLFVVVVCGLLIAVASLVVEHRLQVCRLQQLWHTGSGAVACRLQSAGSVVVVHGLSCSTACRILPGPGLKPLSPALAGGFLTTVPPGKSQEQHFKTIRYFINYQQKQNKTKTLLLFIFISIYCFCYIFP